MPRTRLTAEERLDQLIEAAVTAFSAGGYAGTTTDQVARIAGVSQPYVIRLFGSKQALFIATVRHASARIEERFRAAAAVQPDLQSLGAAYDELLAERELITVLLHGFAAGSDPAIGPVVRETFGRIYPDAWKQVDDLRANRKGLGGWPPTGASCPWRGSTPSSRRAAPDRRPSGSSTSASSAP